MLVPNDVLGDSRVQKCALSAARAGYRVTVLGAASRSTRGAGLLDGVLVARVTMRSPIAAHLRAIAGHHTGLRRDRKGALSHRREAALRRLLVEREARDQRRNARLRLRYWSEYQAYRVAARVAHEDVVQRIRRLLERRVKEVTAARWWRWAWPALVDHEQSFSDVLAGLRPDLIHLHDAPLLPAAELAVRRLRAEGRRVVFLYDVHEWWPGVPVPTRVQSRAMCGMEKELIGSADHVMTVSPDLADWLVARHGLSERPIVVENCPPAERVPAASREVLRSEIGLGAEVPLLVYSGALADRRGVRTVVEALPAVPGVHLAIIANPSNAHLLELLTLAGELGIADRIHTRPYVPAESITWYLSSADIGMAPFHRTTSHDSALATKVSEYLHSGLVIVGSDCTAMARFVRETNVGRIFTAQSVEECAQAIREALAGIETHRAAITPELLRSRAWDTQEKVLLAAYARMLNPLGLDPTAVTAAAADAVPTVVVHDPSPVHPGWAASVLRNACGGGAVIEVLEDDTGAGLATLVERFERVRTATLAVLDDRQPVFGDLFDRSAARERTALRESGVTLVVLGDGPGGTDPVTGDACVPRIALPLTWESAPVDYAGRAPVVLLLGAEHLGAGSEALAELELLHSRGTIQLRPADDADQDRSAEILAADIVVGDLTSGRYGRDVIDAMAAGRVVLGHVGPSVRDAAPMTVPVIEATRGTVAAVVRRLALDPVEGRAAGLAGREYARVLHDGAHSERLLIAACLPGATRHGAVRSAPAESRP